MPPHSAMRSTATLVKLHWPVVLASASAVFLLAARARLAHSGALLFLPWNLVLAWMPLAFAHAAICLASRGHRASSWLAGAAWLAFFPNAPYLVTDLLHFQSRPPIPAWLDLLLLVQFAWLGVALGFRSLHLLHSEISRRRGALVGWAFAVGSLGAGSFGIYLGRFGRWNSWSVLTQPLALAGDVMDKMRHPIAHRATYAFTMVCFAFLLLSYLGTTGLQRARR